MYALIKQLLPILMLIESGGNPSAVGDNRQACGILQIHRLYWIDGCHYADSDWPYAKAFDPACAEQVATWYLLRYGKAYQKQTGKPVTFEVLARIHNGGPRGWNPKYPALYKATTQYWNKVKEQLELSKRKDSNEK
jgi:hypothetical protein